MNLRAVQVHECGPAETALVLSGGVALPPVGPGAVLVRNTFSGVNFHDTYTRSGLYPRARPFVLGCEGGGEVVAVGADVGEGGPRVGDRVVYYCEGSYAEYTAVPAELAAAVPDGLALEAATALAVQGLTAHYLTRSTVALTAEHDVVVTAAAGGTGKLVVQVCHYMSRDL
jgi:NADPH2:quinone reductase